MLCTFSFVEYNLHNLRAEIMSMNLHPQLFYLSQIQLIHEFVSEICCPSLQSIYISIKWLTPTPDHLSGHLCSPSPPARLLCLTTVLAASMDGLYLTVEFFFFFFLSICLAFVWLLSNTRPKTLSSVPSIHKTEAVGIPLNEAIRLKL